MKAKSSVANQNRQAASQANAPVIAGKHRRGYHVAVTQATQNGETTVEEIRVVPKELYSASRVGRVHECSAYDAAISNLYRGKNGFRLSIDRGPGGFQVDLPPTLNEINKIQEVVQTLRLDPVLKVSICQDLSKQAEAALKR